MTHSPGNLGQLLKCIASMAIDRVPSIGTVITSDGNSASFEPPSPLEPNSAILKLTYVPNANLFSLKTNRGDTIEAELPSFLDPERRDNRPVVYLDQRDWSLLAYALYEPAKILSIEERDAAEQLITLARERRIILACPSVIWVRRPSGPIQTGDTALHLC
jgi:hypothetical protein